MATFKQATSAVLDTSINLVGTVTTVAETLTSVVNLGSKRVDQWKREQEYSLDKEFIAFQESTKARLVKEIASSKMEVIEFSAKSELHAQLAQEAINLLGN